MLLADYRRPFDDTNLVIGGNGCSLRDDADNVFIRNDMTEANPLWNMPRAGTPYQSIFERLFECSVYLIADVFDSRSVADDKSLTKVGFYAFPVEL